MEGCEAIKTSRLVVCCVGVQSRPTGMRFKKDCTLIFYLRLVTCQAVGWVEFLVVLGVSCFGDEGKKRIFKSNAETHALFMLELTKANH